MAYVPLAAATGAFSGSILGSFAAGSETSDEVVDWNWRHCFFIQAVIYASIFVTWACLSNKYLDTQSEEKAMARLNRVQDEEDSSIEVLLRDLTTLFTNQVYMLTTLSMVLLTFTATGFQFWTLSYLEVVLKVEETEA